MSQISASAPTSPSLEEPLSSRHQADAQASQPEQFQDCMTCRLVGSTAFIGLGTYNYISGYYHLRQNRATYLASKSMFGPGARHLGLATVSVGFIGAGIYRWFN